MPQPKIEDQIRASVDSFVDELTGLVRQAALEAVEEVLASSGAAATTAPGRRKKRATRKKAAGRKKAARRTKTGRRPRRSPEDLEQASAAVLAYVKKNPGQRLEEISAAMGEDSAELKRPIQNLLAAKKLRTEGQKRGTKYFPAGAGGARKARKKKAGKRRKIQRR